MLRRPTCSQTFNRFHNGESTQVPTKFVCGSPDMASGSQLCSRLAWLHILLWIQFLIQMKQVFHRLIPNPPGRNELPSPFLRWNTIKAWRFCVPFWSDEGLAFRSLRKYGPLHYSYPNCYEVSFLTFKWNGNDFFNHFRTLTFLSLRPEGGSYEFELLMGNASLNWKLSCQIKILKS